MSSSFASSAWDTVRGLGAAGLADVGQQMRIQQLQCAQIYTIATYALHVVKRVRLAVRFWLDLSARGGALGPKTAVIHDLESKKRGT